MGAPLWSSLRFEAGKASGCGGALGSSPRLGRPPWSACGSIVSDTGDRVRATQIGGEPRDRLSRAVSSGSAPNPFPDL